MINSGVPERRERLFTLFGDVLTSKCNSNVLRKNQREIMFLGYGEIAFCMELSSPAEGGKVRNQAEL